MNNFTEHVGEYGIFWNMKRATLALITFAIGILVAVPLRAGVHVTVGPEPVENQSRYGRLM